MPAFDFSGITKTSSAQNYGFLIDQLEIKKSMLASDGKLSPGDYDVLMKQAKDIYSHPGLSPADRSNIQVKIAGYQKEKSTTALSKSNDLSQLNRATTDDLKKNVMIFGNNPNALLESNADALRLKLSSLSQSIDSLQNSGDDPTAHINEYNDTLSSYNDIEAALTDVKSHAPGQAPKSDFVAYLTTNSKGEVVDVKIGRMGTQSNYAETNGLYGGLTVYGKVNRKDGNENVFQLGNTTFKGSDMQISDPNVPGSFRSAPLTASDMLGGQNVGVRPTAFKEIDFTKVRTQSSIPAGSWAKGSSGFLYKRNDDGSYTKYTDTDAKKMQIPDNNIIDIPQSFEQGLLPNVKQTIDGSLPLSMPASLGTPTPTTGAVAPTPAGPVLQQAFGQPSSAQAAPSGSAPGAPTTRTPQSAGGIASKALQFGKGVLQSLWGN